ncbi:MAG: alpha/beta hydrolase [Thermoplasmata archaeon]|nr:alpha/beta hydrolase [Thermoplasmata archaeon]
MSSAPTTGFVDVPGGRIYFERSGSGPALVLLHASIADRRMWDREFANYANDCTVIRYDRRGFGKSDPATAPYSDVVDLERLLDHLGEEQASVLGCSRGGTIAIDFTLTHPGRVRRLIPVAAMASGMEIPDTPEEKRIFEEAGRREAPIAAAWKRKDVEGAIAAILPIFCAAQKAEGLARVQQMLRDNAIESFGNRSEMFAQSLDPPAAGRLGSLHVPTLLLGGGKDSPDARILVDFLERNIPGAQRKTIANADHLVNLSAPHEFDVALRPFLGLGTGAQH